MYLVSLSGMVNNSILTDEFYPLSGNTIMVSNNEGLSIQIYVQNKVVRMLLKTLHTPPPSSATKWNGTYSGYVVLRYVKN